jgi:hypothetical protein
VGGHPSPGQHGDAHPALGEAEQRGALVALEGDPGRDPGSRERLLDRAPDRRARRRDDQRLARQVGGAHLPAGGERVVARDDQHELLLEEHHAADIRRAALRVHEAEREVELVGAQEREHLVGGLLAQEQVDAGMRGVEGREQRRRVERADRRQGADRQPPVHEPVELLQLGDGAVKLGERALRAHGQDLAGLGEPHAPAGAPQQVDAELGLEPADLLGERGLGDVQLAARAGEVA